MVILLAPTAIAAVVVGIWRESTAADVLVYTLSTVLAGFGSWALGRELAPDDQAAAFVAMFLAVIMMLFAGPEASSYGLLVLFMTLGLARQVNRTTGLEARVSDSLLLTILLALGIYSTANPLIGIAGFVSFALDGYLSKPLRRQWMFAFISIVVMVVYMVDHESATQIYTLPESLGQWVAALIALVFALSLALGTGINSLGDVGRKKLDAARVRAGMLVALVVIMTGIPDIMQVGLVTATAAGVCLSSAVRRSFTNPV